jgi:streptomycin 6-kinase
MTELPSSLVRTITGLYPADGESWLRGLPTLLTEIAERWGLDLSGPFAGLSFHYVAPAVRRADGLPVVLKVGVPSDTELPREAEALRFYNGRGMARLLDTDLERGALLLERVQPGTTLADTITDAATDESATRVAARVMRRLWRTLPLAWRPGAGTTLPFPTAADWALGMERLRAEFAGGAGPFPPALVEEAESLFRDLLASESETVLLHGDLHHFNILAGRETRAAAGGDSWLAIDPKGLIGEPAYEAGALLRNPMPLLLSLPEPQRVTARRLDVLTEELGLPRERLCGWGMAQAVLSAWWCWEDGADEDCWKPALRCAELLSTRRA